MIFGYRTLKMQESDIYSGNLILINAQHAYRWNDKEHLVSVFERKNNTYKIRDKEILLDRAALTALNDLMADFGQNTTAENDIGVVGGYRDIDRQRWFFETRVSSIGETEAIRWVAKPGYSEHHSGLAFDLKLYFDNGTAADFLGKEQYTWVLKNCWKYGFILRYPKNKTAITKISYEPWHLRYVGIPHAMIMQKRGLCLEEYIDHLRNYQLSSEYLRISYKRKAYKIYFTEGTSIRVPKAENYELSGNNVDGFIVTTKKETQKRFKKASKA